MQLSKNFSLDEFLKSSAATRYKIDNTPNENVINNLRELCINVLQPIRDNFGKPLTISSGFRCKELNDKVKGSRRSQHLIGQAADFHIKGVAFSEIMKWCINNIVFDQLIDEYGTNAHWLHISFNKGCNRKQTLIYRKGVYNKWTEKD